MMNGNDKQALVIGASGGIGTEITRRLHQRGYGLQLADIDVAVTQLLADDLGGAEVRPIDLTDRTAVQALCAEITQRDTVLDVACVNAGMIHPEYLVDGSAEMVDRQLDVNLRSAIHLIQALAQRMVQQQHGHILVTVSLGGIVSIKGSSIYAATKFGLRGLLMALHSELAPHNVQVSGIYPSGVDTDMLRFEARHGGSALNFVSTPQTVADIGNAVEKALDTGKVEIYPNYGDSISSRLVASFPWLLPKNYTLARAAGRKRPTAVFTFAGYRRC